MCTVAAGRYFNGAGVAATVMPYDPDARRDTPLAVELKKRICRDGPITVAEYMRACLQDPEHGYYVRQPAIGVQGDFITAPEISQTFGEIIGLWSAIVWQLMGSASRLNLVELGPGRGTLMRDAHRAIGKLRAFVNALDIHLVELNDRLANQQRELLSKSCSSMSHHSTLATVPHGPTIIIANEFLDTFPVHQLSNDAERRVTLDSDGRLVFEPEGDDVVESQDYAALVGDLQSRANQAPLVGLFIDYGHLTTLPGNTLQAVRGHRPEHPLCSPGQADLTVHVDFQAFAGALASDALAVDGPISQGEFLGCLGIVERALRLMDANPLRAGEIELGVARLIAPQGMGSRFKVIGVRSADLPTLPAFEASHGRSPRA